MDHEVTHYTLAAHSERCTWYLRKKKFVVVEFASIHDLSGTALHIFPFLPCASSRMASRILTHRSSLLTNDVGDLATSFSLVHVRRCSCVSGQSRHKGHRSVAYKKRIFCVAKTYVLIILVIMYDILGECL